LVGTTRPVGRCDPTPLDVCESRDDGQAATFSTKRLLPRFFQHQLFYSVGMKHLVRQELSEHNEYRVMTVLFMLGGALPIFSRQRFQTLNQARPFSRILVECFV